MGPQHHIDSGTEQPSQLITDLADVHALLDQLDACFFKIAPPRPPRGPLPRNWHLVAQRLVKLLRRIERGH